MVFERSVGGKLIWCRRFTYRRVCRFIHRLALNTCTLIMSVRELDTRRARDCRFVVGQAVGKGL